GGKVPGILAVHRVEGAGARGEGRGAGAAGVLPVEEGPSVFAAEQVKVAVAVRGARDGGGMESNVLAVHRVEGAGARGGGRGVRGAGVLPVAKRPKDFAAQQVKVAVAVQVPQRRLREVPGVLPAHRVEGAGARDEDRGVGAARVLPVEERPIAVAAEQVKV